MSNSYWILVKITVYLVKLDLLRNVCETLQLKIDAMSCILFLFTLDTPLS